MINCYKTNQGEEIILYGDNINLPDFMQLELVKENVDPTTEEYIYHPIVRFDLLLMGILGKRHRENILEEAGISSFNDLKAEYFLVRTMTSTRSRKVREYIVEKYAEIVNNDQSGNNEGS